MLPNAAAGYDPIELQQPSSSLRSPSSPADINFQPQTPMTPLYPPSGSLTPPKIVTYAHTRVPQQGEVEQAQPLYDGMPVKSANSRDLYSHVKKIEHSFEEFDPRHAKEEQLVYAEGDGAKTQASRVYYWLLNVSVVTRWLIFIVPVMGILWIPGILGLTMFPNATVWGVKLLWWSCWLSFVWGGLWGSWAVAKIMPSVIRLTVGVVAIGTRRYIDWLRALARYVALFIWTLAIWASWAPLIKSRQIQPSTNSVAVINLLGKISFVAFLSSALLLFEKFSIQWIAEKFHERSYAERIANQKFAVQSLVILYQYSVDDGRGGMSTPGPMEKGDPLMSRRVWKKALHGVKTVASSTTTVFGNVASEIIGSPVLQPYSPKAMVKTALESTNKSRQLARRLFNSFAKPGSKYLVVNNIASFFQSPEEAQAVFSLFDRDVNGDATREDMELACIDLHREQLSLEHSMQDLDSAVSRLDDILMTAYFFVVFIMIAVALDAQLQTLVTGAGTLILGLSWLIGASLQEVLGSIIFLFLKHPFDVGDRVCIDNVTYTVKEIFLLSTVFVDANGTQVQAPNTMLNATYIQNYRRSLQMSETFTFDVNYATTFDQLETLRSRMLEFLGSESRDFQPAFDVAVVDFPEQGKMTLTADIKYKGNWQQGSLKAQRRNKWICALKQALAEVEIFGPTGNPDAKPDPSRYTLVPWDEVQAREKKTAKEPLVEMAFEGRLSPAGGWNLSDKNAVLLDGVEDVFQDSDNTKPQGLPHSPA